jgi:hypothetical protein
VLQYSDSEDDDGIVSMPVNNENVAKAPAAEPKQEQKPSFKKYAISFSDDFNDEPGPKPSMQYRKPLGIDHSPQKGAVPTTKSTFNFPEDLGYSPMKAEQPLSKFNMDLITKDMSFDDGLDHTQSQPKVSKFLLQKHGLTGDIASMLENESKPSSWEDGLPSGSKIARCPMCNKPVDAAELKALGQMNIRNQEKFCQSHQRKTAQEDWESGGYPTIDWEHLDNRISKHYSFIQSLVNGQDCHYRQALDETVKAGKDRTLLKSTSNITPGYYGSRGLRAISESIMHKFTPLLKRRAVSDKLMSARGVTGFVQSVLVPEVTVLLIKEDMNVETERAREILKSSVGMGELIHDEIRDVILGVDDSDEDDSYK